jgi:adenosylcobinamide amidohydrolase
MKLYTVSTGDAVYRYDKSIFISFEQPRNVLSTSVYNGGYREDLAAVFNHDCNLEAGKSGKLTAATYEAYLRLVAQEAGLDPDRVSGMATGASMENVAIQSETYENLTVTAVVTGGVDDNGGRAGDPAAYFEPNERSVAYKPGTINILLVIDADMPPGTLARALVTCTEAKTAALQELMAGSNYSCGLATGSGTDSTIIITNPASGLYLQSAGKHSKLGELIGRIVKQAVKEALLRDTGMSPKRQHSVLWRLKRFGVTEETLWQEFSAGNRETVIKSQFLDRLYQIDADQQLVTYTSLYVHLLDQLVWNLLSGEEVIQAGNELLALATGKSGAPSPMIAGPGLPDCLTAWTKLVVQVIQ